MQRFISSIVLASLLTLLLVTSVLAAPPDAPEAYTVIGFQGPAPDDGEASLTRYSDKVHIKITTDNLTPKDVYTLWAIVFNNPDGCSDPDCGEDDIFIFDDDGEIEGPNVDGRMEAEISVFWADGKVINNNGTAVFNAMIHAGPPSGAFNFGDGLTDVENAELHFIIRTHGPVIPGQVSEQKSTFLGGCDVNACADHQAAIP